MLGLNLGMLQPVATFALAARRSYNSLDLIHTFYALQHRIKLVFSFFPRDTTIFLYAWLAHCTLSVQYHTRYPTRQKIHATLTVFFRVGDPDPYPQDPHVIGPPGFGSTSHRYGSGFGSRSFPFPINVLSGLKKYLTKYTFNTKC
jgi:hypothetical protein